MPCDYEQLKSLDKTEQTTTTTAEKIRDIQLRLKLTENDFKTVINSLFFVTNSLQVEITKMKQDVKLSDPEPLECWAEKDGNGMFYRTVSQPTPGSIHMREVTPQDEQDRKDAARYRYIKTEKSGVLNWWDGWLDIISVDGWDEMLDKAMEDQ